MAILRNGLMGGITGKLGNTVCYVVNGKQVVRMNVKSTKPPTQKQLDNWGEMAVLNAFLKPVKVLIDVGFGIQATKKRGAPYTTALGYIKKYALKGEAPNREIDYGKVKVSMGSLPNVRYAEMMLLDNQLTVSWSTECNYQGSGSDRVVVLVYYPPVAGSSSQAYFNLCGVERARGSDVIALPAGLSGRPMEIYVFTQAVHGKAVSYSDYLGRI